MAMNAIDFYMEGGKIIKHSWAMGGSSKKTVKYVPGTIDGYTKIDG